MFFTGKFFSRVILTFLRCGRVSWLRKNSMVDFDGNTMWSILTEKFYGRFCRKTSMVDFDGQILWLILTAKFYG